MIFLSVFLECHKVLSFHCLVCILWFKHSEREIKSGNSQWVTIALISLTCYFLLLFFFSFLLLFLFTLSQLSNVWNVKRFLASSPMFNRKWQRWNMEFHYNVEWNENKKMISTMKSYQMHMWTSGMFEYYVNCENMKRNKSDWRMENILQDEKIVWLWYVVISRCQRLL